MGAGLVGPTPSASFEYFSSSFGLEADLSLRLPRVGLFSLAVVLSGFPLNLSCGLHLSSYSWSFLVLSLLLQLSVAEASFFALLSFSFFEATLLLPDAADAGL